MTERGIERLPTIGRVEPAYSQAISSIEELLDVPSNKIAGLDMALCNLVCATGLPGAEDMDIPEYMRRLQALTQYVRRKTQHMLGRFRANPEQFTFPRPVTENFFRVIVLVHALKTDGGLRYNPDRATPEGAEKPFSAKDMLINGLLSDDRIGTCNTIPVVIAAVGRRLGYPLHLCCTHTHVWTRWEGQGERFNIEASGPNDFTDYDDEHYRLKLEPLQAVGFDTSYYLKNLTPVDELALFLFSRGWVLEGHKRLQESLPAWAKCCFLAPMERMYALRAYDLACDVLHVRKFGKPADRGPNRVPLTSVPVGEDLRKLLPPKELAMFLSIEGHFHEVRGEHDRAIVSYRKALEDYPQNPDYRADLERYLGRIVDEGKSSPGFDKLAVSLGLSRTLATSYEGRGLEHERAGDWAMAQCAFAQGGAIPQDGRSCGEHLRRVIRGEIAAGKEPCPGLVVQCDPRMALPKELQATIWAMRDLALRALGRMEPALAACREACRLWPTHPNYAKELRRFAKEQERLKADAAAKPLAHTVVLQGESGFEAPRDGTFCSVVAAAPSSISLVSGSLFPPASTVRTKQKE